jgi:hypothetical protein
MQKNHCRPLFPCPLIPLHFFKKERPYIICRAKSMYFIAGIKGFGVKWYYVLFNFFVGVFGIIIGFVPVKTFP